MNEIKCDVLVIGTGIAGLITAINVDPAREVLIITKGKLRETNTGLAQGGIAAAIDDDDKPLYHYQDTLNAGAGLCVPEAVSVLVQDAIKRVSELVALGANFDRIANDFSLTKEGAHGKRRILHAGDSTGLEIERTLVANIAQQKNIRLMEKYFIKELLVKNLVCYGALAINVESGELVLISAKAVMLASGGLGQIYLKNTNPVLATGDGVAMGFRVGLPVCDMEFVQFHPTTLMTGDRKPLSLFLISEAVRGEGAYLFNKKGDRFMPNYHPLAELAPRDIVARAIVTEMATTDCDHVYLDFKSIKEDVERRFPNIYQRCLEYGYDLNRDPIPVAPAAHYAMGGIKTDIEGRTAVAGLYAAGEVSSVGVHGANRLASNSLLDGLVFGVRAAQHINHYVRQTLHHPLVYVAKVSARSLSSMQTLQIKEQIKETMWKYAGIIRDGAGLQKAQVQLEKLSEQVNFSSHDWAICEVQNMVLVASLIVSFALERKESRGAHYRTDCPDTLAEWRQRLDASAN